MPPARTTPFTRGSRAGVLPRSRTSAEPRLAPSLATAIPQNNEAEARSGPNVLRKRRPRVDHDGASHDLGEWCWVEATVSGVIDQQDYRIRASREICTDDGAVQHRVMLTDLAART